MKNGNQGHDFMAINLCNVVTCMPQARVESLGVECQGMQCIFHSLILPQASFINLMVKIKWQFQLVEGNYLFRLPTITSC